MEKVKVKGEGRGKREGERGGRMEKEVRGVEGGYRFTSHLLGRRNSEKKRRKKNGEEGKREGESKGGERRKGEGQSGA